MKKTRQICSIVFLLVIFISFAGRSQNAPVTVMQNDTVCPYSSLTVPVKVYNFSNITVVSMRIDYDTNVLLFDHTTFNPAIVGALVAATPVAGGGSTFKIMISWMKMSPLALDDGTTFVNLGFLYKSGNGILTFNNTDNDGQDCEYADQNFEPLNDMPTAAFYFNGLIVDGENGGTVSGGTTINNGESTGALSLSGQVGTVLKWQRQFNGGGYYDIPSTAGLTVYSEVPSAIGTWDYRAVTKYNGCNESYSSPATVTVLAGKILNVRAYMEGLFDSYAGTMKKAQDCIDEANTFDKFPLDYCDTLSVYLANADEPWDIVLEAHAKYINTEGYIPGFNVPLSGNYYIVVKHRQSVETWSANPVSFSGPGGSVNYDFSAGAGQAFGNNMKHMTENSGGYALYSGDITGMTGTQDGYVDIFDNNDVFNLAQIAGFGYVAQDLNGDGFVDIFDMALVFNNMQTATGMITPVNPGK